MLDPQGPTWPDSKIEFFQIDPFEAHLTQLSTLSPHFKENNRVTDNKKKLHKIFDAKMQIFYEKTKKLN